MRSFPTVCLLAVVILTAACSSPKVKYAQPKFPEEEARTFELLTEDQLWGGTVKIFKHGDILAVITHGATDDKWLHLYSLNGDSIGDYVVSGRGPFEVDYVSGAYLADGVLYLMDSVDKKIISVELSVLLTGDLENAVSEDALVDGSNWLAYCFPLPNKRIIGVYSPKIMGDIPYEKYRICLFDETGKLLSSYNESPYSEYSPIGRSYLELATSFKAVSPNGRHLALSTSVGAVLEIFSIVDEVKHVRTSYYVEPQFEEKGRSVQTSVKSIAGFGYLYGGNEHLFTVYDGKTSFKDKSKVWFRDIAIFDWNGKPQKLIKTDWSIDAIVTDDDGETFYAVVSDPERHEYLAILK